MASVYQLKDGRWCVNFSKGTLKDDPKRTTIYFGRGLEAEKRARDKKLELDLATKLKHTGPLFEDIVDSYITSRAASMAQSTQDSNFYALKAYILPFFGNKKASQITPELLDKFINERSKPFIKRTELKNGTTKEELIQIKNVTIHRQLSIVKAAMAFAFKRELITSNPIAGYELPKRDDAIQAPPSPEELQAIIKNAQEHLKRAIILSFNTALRPGREELLSLKWEHVDFIARTIFIESAKKGGLESRSVPLTDSLYNHLKEWYDQDKKKEYIIHWNGKQVKSLKKAWRNAKERAKILRRIRLYDIRHAAITQMLEAGADLKSVSLIAGHKDPSMTMKVYQHSSKALKEQAVSSIPNLLVVIDSENKKIDSSQT